MSDGKEGDVEERLEKVPLLLGPDGEPVSREEARRRHREREKEQPRCELPECDRVAARKLPNKVRVCGPCWVERRNVRAREQAEGRQVPEHRSGGGESEASRRKREAERRREAAKRAMELGLRPGGGS